MDIFIGYINDWVNRDSWSPAVSTPKGNSKFEILLLKNIQSKTKNKVKYFQLLSKKSNFYSSRKQSVVPLDTGLQLVNVNQKPLREIWAHSGIIRHIQELFRQFQAYSESFVTLAYSELSRTLTYLEP